MAIKTKAKGSRLERRCIKYLESQGYLCTRAAGSIGVWDIIAISAKQVLLIQVKANRKPGKAERQRMADFAIPLENVVKQLWVYVDGKPRDPIVTEVG